LEVPADSAPSYQPILAGYSGLFVPYLPINHRSCQGHIEWVLSQPSMLGQHPEQYQPFQN
jgi:hypothetical protein